MPIEITRFGYYWLDTWVLANVIQLATQDFCTRFLDRCNDPCGRQYDQMTQAARSVPANIAEGNSRHTTSRETEMKLTDVARASLAELANDYQNWLLRHECIPWSVNSAEYAAVGRVHLDHPEYKDDVVHMSSKHILAQKHKFDPWLAPSSPAPSPASPPASPLASASPPSPASPPASPLASASAPSPASPPASPLASASASSPASPVSASPAAYASPPAGAEPSIVAANCLLILCNRLIMMIGRQIERQLDDFRAEGGFTEGLTAERLAYRSQQSADTGAPQCPLCGKPMLRRVAKKGINSGREFWSCSAYPQCNGTRSIVK